MTLALGDALQHYAAWPAPTVIVSDGPYGVGGFPGDPPTPDDLPAWYAPHLAAWSAAALGSTTLWFWNTEVGWALVHPAIVRAGWEYRGFHVWNKGVGHIAGNANTRTLRKFPVVTEGCAQYVRAVTFRVGTQELSMKDWLRAEWLRTGLPFGDANAACGVRSAATRKYFTRDHLWYYPPPEHFARLAAHANAHGRAEGRPYFSRDGQHPLTAAEWGALRAKFYCPFGVTNVWDEPASRGAERLKHAGRAVHANQKPLRLLDRIIRASSDPGDVVWEPFAGTASVGVAARRAGRAYYGAELLPAVHAIGAARLQAETGAP